MKLEIRKSVNLEALIKGCRKQKAGAQRSLYERFSGRMLAICRRYIGNTAEAEDTMIKGFMKIFENIGQFKGQGSFEGWMSRIMVNESLTYIRKAKNMWIETSVEMVQGQPDYSWAEENLEIEHILKLIDDMPTGYRTVFKLFALEGYSHQEISELVGISTGASKSQLSRARAYLRDRLGELEQHQKIKSHEK